MNIKKECNSSRRSEMTNYQKNEEDYRDTIKNEKAYYSQTRN